MQGRTPFTPGVRPHYIYVYVSVVNGLFCNRMEKLSRPPGAAKAPFPPEKSASEKIFHPFEDIFNPRPPFFRYFCEWKTYISQTKNK